MNNVHGVPFGERLNVKRGVCGVKVGVKEYLVFVYSNSRDIMSS